MLFSLVGPTLRAGAEGASIYLFGGNAVAASSHRRQLSPPNLGQVEIDLNFAVITKEAESKRPL